MANETEWTYATPVVLEASGGSAASNAFVAADDTTLGSANHSNFPWADFALTGVVATTVGSNGSINLYRHDKLVDGTNNSIVPGTANPTLFVGSFRVPDAQASTSTMYLNVTDVPLAANCGFYIENKTNQTLNAGWKLRVVPKTYAPGA